MANDTLNRLTERLRNVLFLVCKGFRNTEIARQVGLSARSVKGYVSSSC